MPSGRCTQETPSTAQDARILWMLSRLRAVARLLTPSGAHADDLVAGSVEAARSAINGSVSEPWLEAVVVARILACHEAAEPGEAPAPDGPCAGVAARLRVLSREERFAFIMVDMLGRSCDEAASAIGESTLSVEDALARARERQGADAG